ncbi:MAG: TfoX/Sxy family protein [Rhizobiaceae bacterium]|nr:TfoX/Sxy family protein [Rhizobiaceae bacterium]
MARTIEQMRNLGAASARMLAEIGVHDEDDLRELGAVTAYTRVKFQLPGNASILLLYAMEAALRDCDWRTLDEKTKAELKSQIGI